MREEIRAKIDEQNRLLLEYRTDFEKAEKEHNGVIPADLKEKFDAQEKRLDALKDTLDRMIRHEEREANIRNQKINAGDGIIAAGSGNSDDEEKRNKKLMTDFRSFLLTNQGTPELRALSAGTVTQGGALVAPVQFVNELIKDIDKKTWVLSLARTFQLDRALSLGAPVLDTDPSDADWTTELGTGNLDSAMNFGQRHLTPNPLAKRAKVSKTLANISNIDQIVRERLAYKFSITFEKALLTGNGASKPLGVMVASDVGIPTSRDVSADNTTTSMTVDGLTNALESLEDGFQNNATWIFHRDGIKQIRKLKDGNGQYLLQPRISEGIPESILGRPYKRSEYMSNTFTTGQYVGIIGDFQHYWIAQAMNFQVQVLLELYAETNQNGYIGRMEADGMPVLAKAFARVKLA